MKLYWLSSLWLFAGITLALAQESTPGAQKVTPASATQAQQQAMIAYTQGQVALKNERFEEAVEKFKQAIVHDPGQAQFRYALAQAYAKVDKWLPRWFQLRQAILLKPDHKEANAAFWQMWQIALDKGIGDVGTEAATVKAALGEPDGRRQEGRHSTWQYGFVALTFVDDKVFSVVDLRGGEDYEDYSVATETVAIDLGERDWKIKQRRISPAQSTLQYEPQQSGQQREQFVVERLADLNVRTSARTLMQTMRATLTERFPAVEWQVLQESEHDVLFEWQLNPQQGNSQREIVRLIEGDKDIHRLAYTAQRIDPETRQDWLQRLQAAQLVDSSSR